MKWLITGGCGFIGKSLIKRLVDEGGHKIRIVDNLSVGSRDDLASVCLYRRRYVSDLTSIDNMSAPGVELVVADILEQEIALNASWGADIIVHLAANTGVPKSVENPRMDCVNNVVGTLNYLEAARHCKVKRFIFASSGAPIGNCEPPIHEEMPCHPVSPYGASKLACEAYCSAYFRTYGLETVVLRFGNVYGPGSEQKHSVVAKFIKQAMNGQTLEIYGDGFQTRDYIFIEDVVRAIMLSAKAESVGGEIFQIATNSETTVQELTDLLINYLKKSGVIEINVKHCSIRNGDVKRNFANIEKARHKLGWSNPISLAEGLPLTINYFVQHSQLTRTNK